MMGSLIGKSSQAIVIDREENIYLESNKKINRLSLIGGKVEIDKDGSDRVTSFEKAMVRELREETGLEIDVKSFRNSGEYQEPREIPNVGIWESMYYTIILETKEETNQILKNTDIKKYSLIDLESMSQESFALPKEKFLEQIKKSLDLL